MERTERKVEEQTEDDNSIYIHDRANTSKWTEEEDSKLKAAVSLFEGKCWKKISECVENRSDVQCLHRWQKVLKPGLIKGPFTKQV